MSNKLSLVDLLYSNASCFYIKSRCRYYVQTSMILLHRLKYITVFVTRNCEELLYAIYITLYPAFKMNSWVVHEVIYRQYKCNSITYQQYLVTVFYWDKQLHGGFICVSYPLNLMSVLMYTLLSYNCVCKPLMLPLVLNSFLMAQIGQNILEIAILKVVG
jgi:hypothetical protein